MSATPRILRALPLLLVVIALACSQNPRRDESTESDYIRMLRDEFFKTHPNGIHNEYIARGEVVRGMDFLEVLASWGNPIKREKPSPDVEYWVYLEEEEETKDWVQYKFVFRKSVLDDWEVARHVAQGAVETQGQSSDVLTKGSGASGVGHKPNK
jgi:hypothetical protein